MTWLYIIKDALVSNAGSFLMPNSAIGLFSYLPQVEPCLPATSQHTHIVKALKIIQKLTKKFLLKIDFA